VVYNLDSI